ncbi:bifunctional sterol desaturase/short chain dehydrogenase [Anabaena cylindrica FACHB-243]|uniref:Fatty acid hydroxylase n=1 Tax=Anabaena cylindrica (strain ATCC 27899 / PCC 7122) TaxID=272123 RepID=K9ZB09_ANACC|nr:MULTISPECIES: bifunctional sterol desaturase/short chain dehydrogenase [Anabaena]AFZ55767.1 fatty acid hydroxylase [Anabaena cylindrica PCC 7122]MBD2420232.1 bifunctional sterol desaturase/short chain dehydrogenase [Anabaena cylindrica FACHB-243]MBY5283103.1 bifunctional sterol desaturase/short chain dehydrogenase [Anabaena sp. CCAP 1446/1C]MBY5307820.1 bifunctional sterol desaturase/short chain dehydrogenase [Anabaena sp. CCAP 1446/1C]MCM2406116.1 bifunctional sterol desaturase/short chain
MRLAENLTMDWVLVNTCIQFTLWGCCSLLLAEILRDSYHALCHQFTWLAKWHNKHHAAYRRDLTLVSQKAYTDSQLYHDIVESIILVVMLTAVALVAQQWGLWLGVAYAVTFLYGASLRYFQGTIDTDYNHLPGPLESIPSVWLVNRSYHWRHHFDDVNAYYSGVFPLVDKVLGTGLSLKGKTVALTGASGALGKALVGELLKHNAKVVALSTNPDKIQAQTGLKVLAWELGNEAQLKASLEKVDILIINHGVNVYSDRTSEAIQNSYQVNTFSALRLIDIFSTTVTGPEAKATKEIWVNTSEAEVSPALSPLYELSKRALGDLITLKRLDGVCVIRKLILGPFKSQLNPYGVMSPPQVARGIMFLAKRDFRNIIVTVNPLTYLLFPVKELSAWLYYRIFSKSVKVK